MPVFKMLKMLTIYIRVYTNRYMFIRQITSAQSTTKGVAQLVARLTCNLSVVCSKHIKGSHCLSKHETLTSLLGTDLFQVRI